jgi:DNA ligase-1
MNPHKRVHKFCRYDGQRAQIHLLPDQSVRIFSRNGEDNTSKFPDVADIVRSAMQPETEMFIIDAEVCFYDIAKAHNFYLQILNFNASHVFTVCRLKYL